MNTSRRAFLARIPDMVAAVFGGMRLNDCAGGVVAQQSGIAPQAPAGATSRSGASSAMPAWRATMRQYELKNITEEPPPSGAIPSPNPMSTLGLAYAAHPSYREWLTRDNAWLSKHSIETTTGAWGGGVMAEGVVNGQMFCEMYCGMNGHQNPHGTVLSRFDGFLAKWKLPISTPDDWTNVSDTVVKLSNYVPLPGELFYDRQNAMNYRAVDYLTIADWQSMGSPAGKTFAPNDYDGPLHLKGGNANSTTANGWSWQRWVGGSGWDGCYKPNVSAAARYGNYLYTPNDALPAAEQAQQPYGVVELLAGSYSHTFAGYGSNFTYRLGIATGSWISKSNDAKSDHPKKWPLRVDDTASAYCRAQRLQYACSADREGVLIYDPVLKRHSAGAAFEGNTGAYLGIASSTTKPCITNGLGYNLFITKCSPRIEVGIRSAVNGAGNITTVRGTRPHGYLSGERFWVIQGGDASPGSTHSGIKLATAINPTDYTYQHENGAQPTSGMSYNNTFGLAVLDLDELRANGSAQWWCILPTNSPVASNGNRRIKSLTGWGATRSPNAHLSWREATNQIVCFTPNYSMHPGAPRWDFAPDPYKGGAVQPWPESVRTIAIPTGATNGVPNWRTQPWVARQHLLSLASNTRGFAIGCPKWNPNDAASQAGGIYGRYEWSNLLNAALIITGGSTPVQAFTLDAVP